MYKSIKSLGFIVFNIAIGGTGVFFYYQDILNQQATEISALNNKLQKLVSEKQISFQQDVLTTKNIEFAETNTELKQQVIDLSLSLYQAEEKLEDKELQITDIYNKEIQTKNIQEQQYIQSNEYIKSTQLSNNVSNVINTLSNELGLSAENSQQLKALLQAKAESDFEAANAMLELNGSEDSDQISRLNETTEALFAENQAIYEEKVAELLSDEEHEQYKAYETKQELARLADAERFRINELNFIVGDLSETQMSDMHSIFKNAYNFDNSTVKLGISGSPYAKPQNGINPDKLMMMQEHIENLLSNEQLEKYQNHQQKRGIK